jgi:hypothetical protein
MNLLADSMLYALTYFPPITYNRQGAYAAPDATEVYSGELQGTPGQVGTITALAPMHWNARTSPAESCKGTYIRAGAGIQLSKQGDVVINGRFNLGPASSFNQADLAATGVFQHIGITLKTAQNHCLRKIATESVPVVPYAKGVSGTPAPSANFLAGLAASVNSCW